MLSSPYNLNNNKNDQNFYQDLSIFTTLVLAKGKNDYQSWIKEYESFIKQKGNKEYSNDEYLMEFLMIGLLWNNYHTKFSTESIVFQPLFNTLYKTRKRISALKKQSDKLRGTLATKILTKPRHISISINQRFEFLNAWLNCSKEFNQELERLELWQHYIESKHIRIQETFWNSATAFAEWFTSEAKHHLGNYTEHWNEFMMDTANIYPNREDYIFCTRKPNEYHLNMVVAGVMNNALSEDYEKTKEKIVLLPTCMAASEKCQSKNIDGKLTCQNCNVNCNIAKLSDELNKKGYSTVLIPHSSSFSKHLEPWKDQKETALIGVACVLNLLTGGYEMQKLNIPSQCVFLDSCSCKKHWLSGDATNLNKEKLIQTLDKAQDSMDNKSKVYQQIDYA